MAKKKTNNSAKIMDSHPTDGMKKQIQLRVRDFKLPLVRDVLILGTEAPIGPEAMHRSLGLMNGRPFQRIEFEDDEIIAAAFIRKDLLKRVSVDDVQDVVRSTIKKLMSRHEVLVVEIDAELQLEVKR